MCAPSKTPNAPRPARSASPPCLVCCARSSTISDLLSGNFCRTAGVQSCSGVKHATTVRVRTPDVPRWFRTNGHHGRSGSQPGDPGSPFRSSDPKAKETWEKLSFTHQKEHVRAIKDAKRPETREK